MATMQIKNAGGVDETIEKPLAPGRAAATASRPVALSNEDLAAIGATGETAPASDTAAAGLNGRMQRVAQRITALIALLPASLGTKPAAASLSTTLASDDPAVVALGAANEPAPSSDTAAAGLNGRLQRIAQRLSSLIALAPANVFFLGTTTPLASSATYTGSARDTGVAAAAAHPYAYFNGFFLADQAGTASLEGSNDNASWVTCASSALAASTPIVLTTPVLFRYYRTKLVNGATAQTSVTVNASFTAG